MEETRPYYSTFSLLTTKSVKSQIVPPPPWIYAIEMIGVKVYFDPGKVLDLIPPPLEIVDGEGFVYVAKIFTVSGNRWEMLYEDPEETKYMEAAVALKVKYNANIYTYFPFMWVDKDLPLIRGWLLGYPKKLAYISMSEFHKLLDGYSGPSSGVKMGGYALRNGKEIIRMKITLREKVSQSPIPFGPILQFRRFPAVQDGTDVYELGQAISSDFRVGEVWQGEGEVILNGSINEALEVLKINKIEGGYYFNWSFKQLGTKILAKIPK
ncbi:acetoacetate decarboxylase family protein [Saccharolobus islandicus]|uniref:acetoacetate decarboxylase family protein n=1 Tax=Saccharolobus islandicus TaxID=43080 RepID=UPI0003773727|nr:acetoacetate decarboxylase family protein [Sulfolobus islandicus]